MGRGRSRTAVQFSQGIVPWERPLESCQLELEWGGGGGARSGLCTPISVSHWMQPCGGGQGFGEEGGSSLWPKQSLTALTAEGQLLAAPSTQGPKCLLP